MSGGGNPKQRKAVCVGLLAHVDAGKTTLAESLLYMGGVLRRMGRVDHQDAYLDTYELERARGITIFSKQAFLPLPDADITLLDTPGHVDFSGEMERTLQILDYAVLVISASDGVQSHTRTLWQLLSRYQIPVFLFVNKMDLPDTSRDALLSDMQTNLSSGCIDFAQDSDTVQEAASLSSEKALEYYLENGSLPDPQLASLICSRTVFPVYFGSALHSDGIALLLDGLCRYTLQKESGASFSARVYKISRDPQNRRLTHMKITGGSLHVRDLLTGTGRDGTPWAEKTDQIRFYSGDRFQPLQEAVPGTVCAVTGLTATYPGEGLGEEPDACGPVLEPVLTYKILLPDGCDAEQAVRKFRQLEEEDPLLHILWNEALQEIHVSLMGEVQLEILQHLIEERFGIIVSFGPGSVVYRETIAAPAYGVGHFEPLRHYAEVHLLLSPGSAGSGLQFDSVCPEDILARSWQRLILTHLQEKEHPGVLTGSPITDMRITLLTGRAHLKHTEGGDFRQATYRAVRHGLMQAQNVLLEPWYTFRLELPTEYIGRAMTDVGRMYGTFSTPETGTDTAVLEGTAPVSEMQHYSREVTSYTKGLGKLSLSVKGYAPCHNTEEVLARIGYDPTRDVDNPPDSVFCSHGAGFIVPWQEALSHMHLHPDLPDGWKI